VPPADLPVVQSALIAIADRMIETSFAAAQH